MVRFDAEGSWMRNHEDSLNHGRGARFVKERQQGRHSHFHSARSVLALNLQWKTGWLWMTQEKRIPEGGFFMGDSTTKWVS